MLSKQATWAAFGSIVKRSLTTATPTRSSPRPQNLRPPHQTLTSTSTAQGRHIPKTHFSSNNSLHQNKSHDETTATNQKDKPARRKAARTAQTASPLRRVAAEAQRSTGKLIRGSGIRRHVDPEAETKEVTAYCAAESYNIHVARHLLQQQGLDPDPFHTGLYPQVLHVQTPNYLVKDVGGEDRAQGAGDVFVFPSGSVVTWNVPENHAHNLVEKVLGGSSGAAENGHLDKLEAEDLDYLEDPTRATSSIFGDTIVLGTKATQPAEDATSAESTAETKHEVDQVLAKIAFSSALARSTKLAVLENSLNEYFATTKSIPATLAAGSQLRHTRAFVLRKTGELLNIRAQLNLYSELTDSLPDLFWDSEHELGLESYYKMVGNALDVPVRITTLNARMDYASEIAAVLRERLSEQHSTGLEWLIIWLIFIEVVYGSVTLWHEYSERVDPDSTRALLHEFLKREREIARKIDEGNAR